MAVRLRLTRMGRKKRPFYRIVAADSRRPRDGKYLELIGTYNPLLDPPEVRVNREVALKWLLQGAQPSDTVRSLLRSQGIMFELDLIKRGLSKEEIEVEFKKWEALKEQQAKKREALLAMKKRGAGKSAPEPAKTDASAAAETQAQPAAEA